MGFRRLLLSACMLVALSACRVVKVGPNVGETLKSPAPAQQGITVFVTQALSRISDSDCQGTQIDAFMEPFREQLRKSLEGAGYTIVTSEEGADVKATVTGHIDDCRGSDGSVDRPNFYPGIIFNSRGLNVFDSDDGECDSVPALCKPGVWDVSYVNRMTERLASMGVTPGQTPGSHPSSPADPGKASPSPSASASAHAPDAHPPRPRSTR